MSTADQRGLFFQAAMNIVSYCFWACRRVPESISNLVTALESAVTTVITGSVSFCFFCKVGSSMQIFTVTIQISALKILRKLQPLSDR